MDFTGRITDYDKEKNLLTIHLDRPGELKANQPATIKVLSGNCNQELRGLLWLMLKHIGDCMGMSARQTYTLMLEEWGHYDLITIPDGRTIKVYKSTADGEIDNKSLGEFTRHCEVWAIDQGFNMQSFIDRHNEIRKQRGKE